MTIIALSSDGKEQCFFWETEGPTVGKYETNVCIRVTITACTNKGCYFLNSIIHYYSVLFFIVLQR